MALPATIGHDSRYSFNQSVVTLSEAEDLCLFFPKLIFKGDGPLVASLQHW